MIHRPYFFDNIKFYLFDSMSQSQVDGCNVFLDWYDTDNPALPHKWHCGDRELAYILATTYHETAFTMLPITEYGSQEYLESKDYYPWHGRGYVQLTWEENYAKQDEKLQLGGALLKNPDLALDPKIALPVIVYGMMDGDFTSHALRDHFDDTKTDWTNARRIVNGTDRADTIASYAELFLNAIAHV